MPEMRKSSEVSGGFPYKSPLVCYFELRGGEPFWLKDLAEQREALRVALDGKTDIYATWQGQYRTGLFVIDDLQAMVEAVKRKDGTW